MHRRSWSCVVAPVALVIAGCGGSNTGVPGPGAEAGADAPLLPTGTCSFQLSGAITGPRSGTGAADMDGSGNLIVTCAGFGLADAGTTNLSLNVGNGTYDGPGTYNIDMSLSHGSVTYEAAPNDGYDVLNPSAGCVIVVTQAPPGNFDPSGSVVAGTFSCQGLADDSGASVAIASGAFNAPVR